MGSSTAFNLVRLEPALKVAVVEKDPTYAKSSTTLSAANLRTVAFSLKENFLISKRTFQILESFEADMAVDGRSRASISAPRAISSCATRMGWPLHDESSTCTRASGRTPSGSGRKK